MAQSGKDTNQRVRTTYQNGVETTVIKLSGKDTKKYKHLPLTKASVKDSIEDAENKRVNSLPVCQCVNMYVEVADSLKMQQYVNYKFVFKNNCAKPIWIYTKRGIHI